MEQRISYSAVVLDERSRQLLKTQFGQNLPEGWEWVCHHMTICMGPITDNAIREKIGQTVTLAVELLGVSELAMAVKVVGFYTTNKIPHITLGVNRQGGGKPKDSNAITDWSKVATDIRLTGTVQEIPFKSAPLNEAAAAVNSLPFLDDVKAAGGQIFQVGGALQNDQLTESIEKIKDLTRKI